MVLQHLLPRTDPGVRAKVRGVIFELFPALRRERAAESLHATLWILKNIFRRNELVLAQVSNRPQLHAKSETLLGLSQARALIEARVAEFREVFRSDEIMEELVVVDTAGVREVEESPVVVAGGSENSQCDKNAVAQLAEALWDASALQEVAPGKKRGA